MDYLTNFIVILATISGSFARSLADIEEKAGDGVSPMLPIAAVLVGVATGVCFLVVIALCACGEKPKVADPPTSSPKESVKANGRESVTLIADANGPTHGSPTQDRTTPLTQSLSLSHAPPSPNNGGPSPTELSSSPSGNILRSSTIERRLPELPPIPPKVPGIDENVESDYNGTYDTIKDDKKNKLVGGAKTPVSAAPVDDDPAYNSVDDTIAAASMRKPTVSADGGGQASGDGSVGDNDYACVKDAPKPSNTDTAQKVEGAVGGVADEPDYDSSYAKVKDFPAASNGNHAYATVKDKKDKDHGYARVKDVHKNNASAPGQQRGAGGADQSDEEVPPVPHKPLDLESPDNPPSPVSHRTGSASSPGSPSRGGGGGGPSGSDGDGPGRGQGPVPGPGPGPNPNPDNGPTGPVGGRREPPYTQVSARESLESIRARQQLEHTQKVEETLAASGGAVAKGGAAAAAGGAGEPDFDGIYEQVDDNSVRGQNNASPPPLPRGRQTCHPMVTRRVYEEITEENRPRPPGASSFNEDPEPYAVVDKSMTEKRPQDAKPNTNGNHVNNDKTKDFDQLYARVNKSGSQEEGPRKPPQKSNHHANNNNHKRIGAEGGEGRDFGELYAKVDKKRKTIAVMDTRGSRQIGMSASGGVSVSGGAVVNANAKQSKEFGVNGQVNAPVASGMNSYSEIYADVDETPTSTASAASRLPPMDALIVENNYQSIDEDDHAPRSPVDERMVHISTHQANPELWVKREHTYQAVDDDVGKKSKGRSASTGDERPRRRFLDHNYEQMRPTELSSGKHINPINSSMSASNQVRGSNPRSGISNADVTISNTRSPPLARISLNLGSPDSPDGGLEGQSSKSPEGSKVNPQPPTRRLDQEERAAAPNLVKVKLNSNNNHMIESLPMKETRI